MRSNIIRTAFMVSSAFCASLFASTITLNMGGTITDTVNNPIQGAVVHLLKVDKWDTTKADGSFSFTGDVSVSILKDALQKKYIAPFIKNGRMFFSILTGNEKVSIKLLNMSGRVIRHVVNKDLPTGSYNVLVCDKNCADQAYIVAITIGQSAALIKTIGVGRQSSGLQASIAQLQGLRKIKGEDPAIDTIVIKKLGFIVTKVPVISYTRSIAMPKIKSSRIVAKGPQGPMHIIMTSTGAGSTGLSKRMGIKTAGSGAFLYPVQRWMPAAQWTGCPDYIEVTVKTIQAFGRWKSTILSRDTAVAGSDSITTKVDTLISGDSTVDVWSGSKKIRFTGSPLALTGFDSLKIPNGTIYSLILSVEPYASIKGSITGNFVKGNSEDTATKTYYTKAAYSYDRFTKHGGAMDSLFTVGPAESTSVILNPSNDPNNGGPGFQITTACTTAVKDSLTLTVLFDISRTLFFWNGVNYTPNSFTKDTAYFYTDPAFSGPIAAIFPGKYGTIEGYKYIYVTNSDQGSIDADSSAPPLRCDTTMGFTGWMNCIYNSSGALLGLSLLRDSDGSFGPWGGARIMDTVAGNYVLGNGGAGQGESQLYGFHRVAGIGDTSDAVRVYQPSIVVSPGVISHKRSGQVKFILKVRQQ